MEQEKSFSKFGKSFQEDLCHLIVNDRSFADQMFEVLDLNFLELKHLRVFVFSTGSMSVTTKRESPERGLVP